MGYQNVEQLNTELRRRATNLSLEFVVGGDGNMQSKVALVGEAPGVKEMEAGKPFIGASGSIMWTCLRTHTKLNRFDVFATNVMKRQVSVTADADEKVKVQLPELNNWKELLLFELQQLPNLEVIVLLGNYALKALTGNDGILHWRGSVLDYVLPNGRKVKLVAMVNPAMIMREPMFQPVFQLDMAKLQRVIAGEFREHYIVHHINPTFAQAFAWLDKMEREHRPVAFDIETMSNETACIGFANDAHEGMCINLRTDEGLHFTLDEETRLYRKMQRVLTRCQLIAQNGNFDSYWLWYKDRIRPNPIWFDTMLAHHTLYPTLPHSLGFLTSVYTNHPYYKDDGKMWKEKLDRETGEVNRDIDAFWRYNVKDVCITLEASKFLIAELSAARLDRFFMDHVMKLQPHLTRMTVLGVKCDASLKETLNVELTAQLEKTKEEWFASVHVATGRADYFPNPASPQQLSELFYDELSLPSKGKRSVDKTNRERLQSMPLLPESVDRMIQALDRYAKEAKFLGTYVRMPLDEDSRIRCDYHQTGTQSAPGRLSSSATLWGSGSNLQNQPEAAQKMFIADEGYEFTYTDGSQAEARIVARIANCKPLLENFEAALSDKTFDVHRANAARIFKKPYEEIPAYDRDPETLEPTLRFLGKRCVHGLNYRMGPDKLASVCRISRAQANEAYYAYHRAFPEIKRWWSAVLQRLRSQRMLRTCMGRRLILLGVDPNFDNDALDSIIAFEPQSTIGDKVSSLIYECHNDPEWPKTARVCLNIHDALIALNEPKDGETVRRVMKRHAEKPLQLDGGPVMIPFEFKKSVPGEDGLHRWSHLVKVKE